MIDHIRVFKCNYPDENGCNSNADRTMASPPASFPGTSNCPLYDDGPASWTYRNFDDANAERDMTKDKEVERRLQINVWNNNGQLDFAHQEVEVEGRGTVIEVTTSGMGNISLGMSDHDTTKVLDDQGVETSEQTDKAKADNELTRLSNFDGADPNDASVRVGRAGDLRFEMYIDKDETDIDGKIHIKMDSVWPKLGEVVLDVSELPMDQWFPVSVKVNDILNMPGNEPLDTNSINSFFVLEPTHRVKLMIDNISLTCGHPSVCGILPPTYFGTDETRLYIDDELHPTCQPPTGTISVYADGNIGSPVDSEILRLEWGRQLLRRCCRWCHWRACLLERSPIKTIRTEAK